MAIHSILVPTDFSQGSARAYRQALALAERKNAQMLLLHVLLSSALAFGDTPLPMREQLEKELQLDAEQRLESISEGADDPDRDPSGVGESFYRDLPDCQRARHRLDRDGDTREDGPDSPAHRQRCRAGRASCSLFSAHRANSPGRCGSFAHE